MQIRLLSLGRSKIQFEGSSFELDHEWVTFGPTFTTIGKISAVRAGKPMEAHDETNGPIDRSHPLLTRRA